MIFNLMLIQSLVAFSLGVCYVHVLNSKKVAAMNKKGEDIAENSKAFILGIFMIFNIFMIYATLYAFVALRV